MGKKGTLWDKKGELTDLQDPEVLITGIGRMKYSQLKKRIVDKLDDTLKWAKSGEFGKVAFVLDGKRELMLYIEASVEIEEEIIQMQEFVKKFRQ